MLRAAPCWTLLATAEGAASLIAQYFHQWSFNLKVNRLGELMDLDSMRHQLAAAVGRGMSCLPGWTKGHYRHLDLLHLTLSHLRGQPWWYPHCRGVWCHHRSRPPPSPPPGQADTNVWSRVHANLMFSRRWRCYLAFGGGFTADCDLLQGVTMAEVFQWRQQSWGGFSARRDRALGSLLSSSRCLKLDSGGGKKLVFQR